MTEFEHLCFQVRNILTKVNVEKEERRKRGESFNIFDTLGVSSSEVRTHSAFLAELLDPNGSHGLGDYPLNTFVSLINNLSPIDINPKNAMVYKELGIGTIDEKYDNGGQIDICIKSGEYAIVIENKINAGDQNKQLLRYHRYSKKKYKDFLLLYLTLDRHLPSSYSTQDEKESLCEGKDYYCISYEEHITNLVSACIREAFDKPLIRETLVQYSNLIQVLTHKEMGNLSRDELLKLMLDHSECVSEVINYRDEYLRTAVVNHFFPQLEKLAKKHQLVMGPVEDFLTKKIYVGIDFWEPGWKDLRIRLECDSSNWRETFVGVCLEDGDRTGIENPFSCMENANTLWVGGWKYLKPRQLDYSSVPTIIAGDNGGGFYSQIDDIITCIMQEAKDRDM